MTRIGTLLRLARIFAAYRLKKEIVNPLPVRLWIETSLCCNLRCPMCPNKDLPPSEKTVMKPETFRKIIDEAKDFANDIYLHHRGEPLTNPDFVEMLSYAKKAGLKTRFHTNGTLLTREKADQLLSIGPNLVSFSVDGFDRETYEKVRAGASFEKTIENIRYFAGQKKKLGLDLPYIVIEKIRFKNASAPAADSQAVTLRKELLDGGVDEIIEKEEYVWAGDNKGIPLPPRTCSCCTFPWYAMVICSDGTVTPCPQDFFARMVMGNVTKQSLREIWNGPAYRELRRKFKTNVDSLELRRVS